MFVTFIPGQHFSKKLGVGTPRCNVTYTPILTMGFTLGISLLTMHHRGYSYVVVLRMSTECMN